MIPSSFDYVKAGTVDEAVSALADAGEDAKVLGGGQSLLPVLRLRLNAPTVLIDVSSIADMKQISDDGDALSIGAAATTHEVMHNALVKQHAPLLALAAGHVADPAIRHRGTFRRVRGTCRSRRRLADCCFCTRCRDGPGWPGRSADGCGA